MDDFRLGNDRSGGNGSFRSRNGNHRFDARTTCRCAHRRDVSFHRTDRRLLDDEVLSGRNRSDAIAIAHLRLGIGDGDGDVSGHAVGEGVGGSALLFPANDRGWSLIACLLAGAPPLWLAALGVTMAVYFLVRSTNVAAFLTVGILGVLPPILQGLGILIHPVFEVVRQFTPAVVLDNLSAMAAAGRWDYVAQCWIVGLAWLVGATLIGLLSFRKMEIK